MTAAIAVFKMVYWRIDVSFPSPMGRSAYHPDGVVSRPSIGEPEVEYYRGRMKENDYTGFPPARRRGTLLVS